MSIHSKGAIAAAISLVAIARPLQPQHVTGIVRDSASREPVPSAVVRLFDASNRELERTITTSGTFHICGLAADDTVRLKGVLDSLDASGEARFKANHDSLLAHVTLHMVVPPFRARVMRVLDEHGSPIRSASLLDDETGEVRATTNFAGEASLGWLRRGRTNIPVQRPGYEPERVTINVTPTDTTTVIVQLRRRP